jgi:hypothetical protein
VGVDVCYVVSHGFAARMVLHSGLVPKLRALGLTVAVLAPRGEGEAVPKAASAGEIAWVDAPPPDPRRANLYGDLRPYLTEDVRRNPALLARHQRMAAATSRRRRLQVAAQLAVSDAGRAVPALRRPFLAFERRLLHDRRIDDRLDDLAPRAVVSTYPVNALDAGALAWARTRRVRTIGHLLSWDNITCKGRFTEVPERFVAWGPIMRDELREHYGVSNDHVVEAGVPHFDAHASASPEGRTAAVARVGLDPARPYLFFGMSAPIFAPHEIDVVEALVAEVRQGRFGEGMQLVVRPHPQNVTGAMADAAWLPRLDRLGVAPVGIDWPRVEKTALLWSMAEDDLPGLANLLSGAAVVLNSGSTLSIDALVHDRPVVLTPYDADRADLPWWASARRVVEYVHLAKLLGYGGVRVVRGHAEMVDAILAYLADPSRDRDARRRALRAELAVSDGTASAACARAIAAFLDRTA